MNRFPGTRRQCQVRQSTAVTPKTAASDIKTALTVSWRKEAGRGALTEHEIRQQTVPAAFATKTAFLVTPEWARWIKFVIGVLPNHPGDKLTARFADLAPFVRPDAGA